MNIIIPMAGAGQRFANEGYKIHKPAIPTIARRTGKEYPMVVCATMDLPFIEKGGSNVTYIDRIFHKTDGVEKEIIKYFPNASFITVDQLTEGQACTCLLAKEKINVDESLLIAGCDNGMVMDNDKFVQLTKECDVIVFTYRHNEAVLANPNAYGWVEVDESNKITGLSIKKAISDTPMEDHAIVATFWFKHGSDFVRAAEKMIAENDRINNEFYVDEVIKHTLELGLDARVFEIDRYIGWGTPKDYEEYTATINYWKEFVSGEKFLPKE
ncbi:glycosyltransferase family protein [Velocimicrobium porci]|uniref:Nucleotidyltransferase n=1 Tax=Velocimicrobium porci TaxID=2606634 RepID=A0A6L5Y059_9FIRM|nr:nucleotidyltransferase [Velocimicrobium porci]MSS64506.1 nucleotidyltransferase [Velocimicrobium porci]